MVEIEQTLKESAIANLSEVNGTGLEISANLTNGAQLEIVLEAFSHKKLGCDYVSERSELLLRMTKSIEGRHRTDIVELSKGPEVIEGAKK